MPLHLNCVFQFMNVLRPRKHKTPIDDRPEVCHFVQNLVSYLANPETVAPGVSFSSFTSSGILILRHRVAIFASLSSLLLVEELHDDNFLRCKLMCKFVC